ncbi:hypothetical protein ACEQ8H_006816 [Pleosporales sp. CAS-2024a]
MASEKPWGRRLVICCDGTWQTSVGLKNNIPSNVTKLCRLIARTGTDQHDASKKFHQLVYYDSGVGTGDLSSSEARRQGGTGAGLAENVIEAYNFIVMNYEPGDEIFCFGFSRGAYTARAVAGLVSDIGVIKPIHMQSFPDLYRAYMSNDEGLDFRQTRAWKWFTEGKLSAKGKELSESGAPYDHKNPQQVAEWWDITPHGELAVSPESRNVKVVGVWDTVGSLGVPDVLGLNLARKRTKYGFHNVKLTGHIEHAYQALALDERRKPFRPTLWYIPKELVDDPDTPTPELKQVWFPGVHINCGGGDDDCFSNMKGDNENLSTSSFVWMLQCISPHLAIDQTAFDNYIAQYLRWLASLRFACTYHHPKIWGRARKHLPKVPHIPIIWPKGDELRPPKRDAPHAHDLDFSWGTGPFVDSFRSVYHLAGSHKRRPGHEDVEVYNQDEDAWEWKPLRHLGATNEYIHPIALHRSIVRGWDKHNPLRKGWTREHRKDDEGNARYWWYMHEGKEVIELPEWAILPDVANKANFERAWYRRCEKSKKTIDRLSMVGSFGENDFLAVLDKEIDFGFDAKPQNQWP